MKVISNLFAASTFLLSIRHANGAWTEGLKPNNQSVDPITPSKPTDPSLKSHADSNSLEKIKGQLEAINLDSSSAEELRQQLLKIRSKLLETEPAENKVTPTEYSAHDSSKADEQDKSGRGWFYAGVSTLALTFIIPLINEAIAKLARSENTKADFERVQEAWSQSKTEISQTVVTWVEAAKITRSAVKDRATEVMKPNNPPRDIFEELQQHQGEATRNSRVCVNFSKWAQESFDEGKFEKACEHLEMAKAFLQPTVANLIASHDCISKFKDSTTQDPSLALLQFQDPATVGNLSEKAQTAFETTQTCLIDAINAFEKANTAISVMRNLPIIFTARVILDTQHLIQEPTRPKTLADRVGLEIDSYFDDAKTRLAGIENLCMQAVENPDPATTQLEKAENVAKYQLSKIATNASAALQIFTTMHQMIQFTGENDGEDNLQTSMKEKIDQIKQNLESANFYIGAARTAIWNAGNDDLTDEVKGALNTLIYENKSATESLKAIKEIVGEYDEISPIETLQTCQTKARGEYYRSLIFAQSTAQRASEIIEDFRSKLEENHAAVGLTDIATLYSDRIEKTCNQADLALKSLGKKIADLEAIDAPEADTIKAIMKRPAAPQIYQQGNYQFSQAELNNIRLEATNLNLSSQQLFNAPLPKLNHALFNSAPPLGTLTYKDLVSIATNARAGLSTADEQANAGALKFRELMKSVNKTSTLPLDAIRIAINKVADAAADAYKIVTGIETVLMKIDSDNTVPKNIGYGKQELNFAKKAHSKILKCYIALEDKFRNVNAIINKYSLEGLEESSEKTQDITELVKSIFADQDHIPAYQRHALELLASEGVKS